MKQGNYKSLILKLSGTALGLVVMLAGAAALGHNFMTSKSLHSSNYDSYEYSMASPETHMDADFVVAMKDEFKIISENGKWVAEQALKDAEIALEGLKAVHIKKMINTETDMVAELSNAIQEITKKTSIPSELKETIISDLEMQLEKNEIMLQELEEHVVNFSYKMILPQSQYNSEAKCGEEVIIEKCNENCAETNGKENYRGSKKAFSWI